MRVTQNVCYEQAYNASEFDWTENFPEFLSPEEAKGEKCCYFLLSQIVSEVNLVKLISIIDRFEILFYIFCCD